MKSQQPSSQIPEADPASIATRASLLALAAVAAGVFLVYLRTGAPGAWWGDGLELACAAKSLGIAHPTGYPLYTVLGWGAMHALAWIDPGRALTIMSALFCAAAAWGMGWIALRELRAGRSESPLAGAVAATLLFAFARSIWEHATFAEVYPLTLLFSVAIMGLIHSGAGAGASPARRSAALGALCGLAALNHYSLIELAPLVALALIDWGRDGERRLRAKAAARNFAALFGAAAPCLLGYLYLPIRAAANPALNWGDPSSLSRLLWVLRGGDYVGMSRLGGESGADAAIRGLRVWIEWWGMQAAPERFAPLRPLAGLFIVGGALIGCWLIARRRRLFGAGLAATILMSGFVFMLYRIPDPEGYPFPAMAPLFLGWIELLRAASARVPALARSRIARVVALPAIALLSMSLRYPQVDKSWDDGPAKWAERAFEALPQGAVIVTRQGFDSEVYALWHEQIARGRRPDVTVFASGFIFQGWYREYFESAGRPRVPVYAVDRPPADKAAFDAALVGGVIAPNIVDRPVFVTFQDELLSHYFSPRRAAVLLPPAYYEATAYKLRPPEPFLYQLQAPNGAFSSPPTHEELRRFFAGISERHLARYEELFTTETQRHRE